MVLVIGYIVLAAIVAMLFSLAFLRGGHPPASGIVNLAILIVVCPLSIVSAWIGLTTRPESLTGGQKHFYMMAGVATAFAIFSIVLLVLKVGLGKAM